MDVISVCVCVCVCVWEKDYVCTKPHTHVQAYPLVYKTTVCVCVTRVRSWRRRRRYCLFSYIIYIYLYLRVHLSAFTPPVWYSSAEETIYFEEIRRRLHARFIDDDVNLRPIDIILFGMRRRRRWQRFREDEFPACSRVPNRYCRRWSADKVQRSDTITRRRAHLQRLLLPVVRNLLSFVKDRPTDRQTRHRRKFLPRSGLRVVAIFSTYSPPPPRSVTARNRRHRETAGAGRLNRTYVYARRRYDG